MTNTTTSASDEGRDGSPSCSAAPTTHRDRAAAEAARLATRRCRHRRCRGTGGSREEDDGAAIHVDVLDAQSIAAVAQQIDETPRPDLHWSSRCHLRRACRPNRRSRRGPRRFVVSLNVCRVRRVRQAHGRAAGSMVGISSMVGSVRTMATRATRGRRP
jgi:hypothetical protein